MDRPKWPVNVSGLFGQEYAMAGGMMRELAQWGFEGKIRAVVEREDSAGQKVDLGAWQAIVSFGTGMGNAVRGRGQGNWARR